MNTTSRFEKLQWYLNRLRCMSPSEIAHRTSRELYLRAQRVGFFTAHEMPAPETSRTNRNWIGDVKGIDSARYLHAAQQILDGQLQILAIESANFDSSPQWNRDPRTGKVVPLIFGAKINYRDPKLVGDIKYLWEPNRHLQLVTLAQAYHLSDDQRYLDGISEQLNSWFDQCPYLLGLNWSSSLELGIRLINWSIVWNLIGGLHSSLFENTDGRVFRDRWLMSVYQHMHFIQGHVSRFSSANNHLIGEAAGLFVAATIWPFWRPCERWQEVAFKILVREALLQNFPDGVNQEQAIWYQQFVLDFMLISALTGRANNIEFPKAYWDRMEAMLEYIASLMDVAGCVPMIGDADDGLAVRLSHEERFCPYRSLLATGAILFARGDFKKKASYIDDKTRWLLGQQAEDNFAAIKVNGHTFPVRREFPKGGYYILGCKFETPKEVRLVVDAGPIGYQSIAAHGHADALAFTLSISGVELLIDPGTYSYHEEKKWRDYFRGTAAHNTLQIDGLDQSTSGGSFMWLQKANAVCEIWEPGNDVDHFVGKHDGYLRLPDPVIHRREIWLFKKEGRILVEDTLQCRESHTAEHFWHFAESCQISLTKSKLLAHSGSRSVHMHLPDHAIQIETRHGNASLPSGWVSRRYDVKTPTTTVAARSPIHGTTTLTTEIRYFMDGSD